MRKLKFRNQNLKTENDKRAYKEFNEIGAHIETLEDFDRLFGDPELTKKRSEAEINKWVEKG